MLRQTVQQIAYCQKEEIGMGCVPKTLHESSWDVDT